MEYSQALNYLESLQSTNIKLGLERIRAACAAFGHPERKFPSVIVAGTNGKGSTCAFLESILRHHGLKAGLYTSPHLTDVRERIQIDRKMISKREFTKLVDVVKRAASHERRVTYFEFLTLMAFLRFAEQRARHGRSRGARPEQSRGVDIAVLEVGLGGQFDATNVVTPLVSVITRIGLDHQRYLGNTLEKIAFEKAGIIKEGVPVVTVDQHSEVMRVIRDVAEERGSLLYVVSPHEAKYRLGLLGEHQNENAALAIRAGEIVVAPFMGPSAGPINRAATDQIISTALAATRWPGRLEIVSKKPLVILDGAHNPNGAEALARFLMSLRANGVSEAIQRAQLCSRDCFARQRRARNGKRIITIFGAMEDKDIAGIVRPLLPVVDEWVITRPNMERAARIDTIHNIIDSHVIPANAGISRNKLDSRLRLPCRQAGGNDVQISEFPDVKTAIKRTLAAMSKNDTLIITGSLYMVAEWGQA